MTELLYLVVRGDDNHDKIEVDIFEDSDHAQEVARLTGGVYQEQTVFHADDEGTEEFLTAMREGVYS